MEEERTYTRVGEIEKGMTVRDYFASAALPGVIVACDYDQERDSDDVAREAYYIADAMMEYRK